MPTYEYTCQKCGEQIEVFQSFSAKPLKKHKECGGELKKVFHARGVVFKGSGFYKTDSKKAASGSGSASSSSSTSSSSPTKKETTTTAASDSSSSD